MGFPPQQPPCHLATALSLQPPSPICHPEWLTCLRQVKDGMNEEWAEVLVWIGLRRRK